MSRILVIFLAMTVATPAVAQLDLEHAPINYSKSKATHLTTRLFRYPCSFLIESEPFRCLHAGVTTRVWQHLDEILSGRDKSSQSAHLTANDRCAVREIIGATCCDSPFATER